ncbi:M91 family zinc metallopeptidase [Vibrio hepatarius]|uniref:M91 family zinc metallopeptidase n=1 Tax=Vibrio hepatarius TaxID=171383 RepID=UPI001C095737|nr:M91 family zinc metallopeptidase [Vibrio hepatarius]MBU2896753.1 type III secretion system effector protein [Vibrio hepatarius]
MERVLVILLSMYTSYAAGTLYYGPADGETIIDVCDPKGYLFKIEKGVYVQSTSQDYIKNITNLLDQIKSTPSGRALLRQVSHYHPLPLPGQSRALPYSKSSAPENVLKKIHVVINEATGNKNFVTEPLVTELSYIGHQSNGLGVPARIYFNPKTEVVIPGTRETIKPSVALGHELVHARDYLSGGLPTGMRTVSHVAPVDGVDEQGMAFTQGERIEFQLARKEFEATGLAYRNKESFAEIKKPTITRQRSIERRQSYGELWYQAKKQGIVSRAEYKEVRTNLALLKKEKPVTEYHLAKELGVPNRDMYWPGRMIPYQHIDSPHLGSKSTSMLRRRPGKVNALAERTHTTTSYLDNSDKPLVVVSSSVFSDHNMSPKMNRDAKNIIDIALATDSDIVVLDGDEFRHLSYGKKKYIRELQLKAISSASNNSNVEVKFVSIADSELIGEGLASFRQASHVVLFSPNNEVSSIKLAQYISGQGTSLMVNHTGELALHARIHPFQLKQAWADLALQQDVTLIPEKPLPRLKKCWSL